ncbi:MBL fold metallo-hydrolase [Saccharicrinis sp. FJH54]|uniref:MBL fold metallo-hydrolase n=1 Tax=Saccharicrinis sp. FJH54 TaxID=3344665 RepID=UPI0035D5093D
MKLLNILLFAAITLSFYSCGNNKHNWYHTEKIDDQTFIISEPYSSQKNSCFLIISDKKAILIDAGSGENKKESIYHTVSGLTNKPITLILSHFHFDHIGFITDFDRIVIFDTQLPGKNRFADSTLLLTKKETLNRDSLLLHLAYQIETRKDLDLGNRTIQILNTPGHSPNSITVIDKTNKYIFAGDLVYNGLLLIDDMDSYLKSIDLLRSVSNNKYRIYGAHGKPGLKRGILDELKEALSSFRSDRSSFMPVEQTDFYGTKKDVYRMGTVSFIHGYTDVFLKDKNSE